MEVEAQCNLEMNGSRVDGVKRKEKEGAEWQENGKINIIPYTWSMTRHMWGVKVLSVD